MHQPARLPENFDQILQNTPSPCSGIWFQNTPPPLKIKIVPRVQVQPYPEHPSRPENEKTLTFFPEFKFELTQNPPPPQKMKNQLLSWGVLVFLKFWQFWSELTKTWNSGATECGVWIGNCYVKVWKTPQYLSLTKISAKRVHPWVQIWAYPEHPPKN